MQKLSLWWVVKEIYESSCVWWCKDKESEINNWNSSLYLEIDSQIGWEISNKGDNSREVGDKVCVWVG